MLRNYLAAFWGSARRDRLYSLINLVGLGIGLAAAILIALYVRHELSYDDFLIDSDRVYRLTAEQTERGRAPIWLSGPPDHIAAPLALAFPEFDGVSRLAPDRLGLRHGAVEASEMVYWADPSFLSVIGLTTIAGDPRTALATPDAVVLTRSMARKYFGADTPIGQTLEFRRQQPMRVTAVIEDLPSNSHLAVEILASGLAPSSPLAEEDRTVRQAGRQDWGAYLYVRLKPGVSVATLEPRLAPFVANQFPPDPGDDPNHPERKDSQITFKLDPIRQVHLLPYAHDMKEPTSPATLAGLGLIGGLILAVAIINFVNLMTARALRRAIEVGVRKAMGATRAQLITQFMAEAIAFAGAATVIGVALVELLLPAFNAALDRQIAFPYGQDPVLLMALVALAGVVGAAAGVYPALVLSSFAPAAVLKSGRTGTASGGRLREALVILQFAVSIGLAAATLVISWQTDFATRQSLRLDQDQVLLVLGREACVDRFRDQITALPGVRGAVCSRSAPADYSTSVGSATLPDGREVRINRINVDTDFFRFYGLKPLAGRWFERARAGDSLGADPAGTMAAAILINQSAMRAFGYADPAAAIGQSVTVGGVRDHDEPSPIIGVVPDFPIGTIRRAVEPSVFFVDPTGWSLLSVKLSGDRVPETLAAIDRVWASQVADRPIRRLFLDEAIERLYREIERQGRIFTGFATVAIVIGCLGLFALSAFAADRRTKEIGIRKALGASTGAVTRLLIWQFAKPVLIANAIAWPIAGWFLQRWLDGFAYRIDLTPWPFLIAGGGALAIGIATTAFHALQVARLRPVLALRYE